MNTIPRATVWDCSHILPALLEMMDWRCSILTWRHKNMKSGEADVLAGEVSMELYPSQP